MARAAPSGGGASSLPSRCLTSALLLLALVGTSRRQGAHAQGASALLPTWQVPTSQSSVLPATRVAAGGFFNGSGLVVTGGSLRQTGPQSSPLAPASYFAQGAFPLPSCPVSASLPARP